MLGRRPQSLRKTKMKRWRQTAVLQTARKRKMQHFAFLRLIVLRYISNRIGKIQDISCWISEDVDTRRNTQKKNICFLPKGVEPMTLQILVRCSYHLSIGGSGGEEWWWHMCGEGGSWNGEIRKFFFWVLRPVIMFIYWFHCQGPHFTFLHVS